VPGAWKARDAIAAHTTFLESLPGRTGRTRD
jgi:hypothetical protein